MNALRSQLGKAIHFVDANKMIKIQRILTGRIQKPCQAQ